ncbi:MAG: helix-turn-helix domain-containing protein [Pseudomonadales bacterium]|nr:helix-turn-helix domain-containing protein [Pseudomonadales bacterium]
MVSKPMEELLTLSEAAQILKVHPNTLRLWDKKGVLKAVRIGVKKVRRYKKEDIEKFIKESNKKS